MGYSKKIVCLANSRKYDHKCIAGIEVLKDGYGEWIRPVSDREHGEISIQDCTYEDKKSPKLLDVISIQMIEPKPNDYQIENHLIDTKYYWCQEGELSWAELKDMCDNDCTTLWENGYDSYSGKNDRIPMNEAVGIESSLLLIQPESIKLQVAVEGREFQNPRRKVRAIFKFNGIKYILAVTDSDIEGKYLQKDDGDYVLNPADIFLCISLGAPYMGFCYKLVASIISKNELD